VYLSGYPAYSKPTSSKNYYYGYSAPVNRRNSPYGSGWTIEGITKIVRSQARLDGAFPDTCVYPQIDGTNRLSKWDNGVIDTSQDVITAMGACRGKLNGNHVAIIGTNSYGSIYWEQEGSNVYTPPYGSYDTLTFANPGWTRKTVDGIVELYNANGLLQKRTDKRGYSTLFSYDANGERVTEITDEITGRSVRFEYDGNGKLDAIIDQYGRRTEVSVDDNGDLVEVQDPDGTVSRRFEYGENHRAVHEIFADNRFSTYN
jgi:YD repeat-containing protein